MPSCYGLTAALSGHSLPQTGVPGTQGKIQLDLGSNIGSQEEPEKATQKIMEVPKNKKACEQVE